MPSLPAISGAEAVRAFQKAGWTVQRQKGSHVILTRPNSVYNLSIPQSRTVPRGTLRDAIRKAGLTVDEFIALLD
jgi:predicted RNA binding protein YcfA (HicA-like mRNA interferase family)